MEITAYTLLGCSHCKTLRELFKRAGTEYTEIMVKRDMTLEDFSASYPHVSSFPFVVVDGNEVGDLIAAVKLFVVKGLVSSSKKST